MGDRETGFSMLELLVALLILGIIVALALPTALTTVKNYRLHSDATALASYLNVIRMKAASQYAPYRLNVDTSQGTYLIEKLCGITPTSVDSACTTPYHAFTTRQYELGTQYVGTGDSFSSCRPTGISAYPGSITTDPAGCPTSIAFYFNTRGLPVDNAGGPLTGGGAVLYLSNQYALRDAVTVSIGGAVSTWNWQPSTSTWKMR